MFIFGGELCCLLLHKPLPPSLFSRAHRHTSYCFTAFLSLLCHACVDEVARRAAGERQRSGVIKSLQVELCQHLPSLLRSQQMQAGTGQREEQQAQQHSATALLPSGAPWTAEYQGQVKCAVRCVREREGVWSLRRKGWSKERGVLVHQLSWNFSWGPDVFPLFTRPVL